MNSRDQRHARTHATTAVLTLGALALAAAACTPSKAPVVPETFEITGRTVIDGQIYITARDTGTGCEIIITSSGIMPRNERSADGATVKQRCVLTGSEQVTAPTTTILPPDPAQTSVIDSQASAVAEAVRQATLPPPTARNIPPPSGGGTKPRAVPPAKRPAPAPPDTGDTADGVESQLKK